MRERVRDAALYAAALAAVCGLLARATARRLGHHSGTAYYKSASRQLLVLGAVVAFIAMLLAVMP